MTNGDKEKGFAACMTSSFLADTMTSPCHDDDVRRQTSASKMRHCYSTSAHPDPDPLSPAQGAVRHPDPHPLSPAQGAVHHQHVSSPSSSRPPLPSSSCPHLRQLLLLSLTLATLTAVTVGVSSMKKEYTLQIGVPEDILIRKVRTFSKHPELSELVRSQSSLSLVSRLQLIDLNGCHGNLSQCQTVAVCDGGDNDLLCRCRRGYYFRDRQCHECRKSCPDGHHLVTPCSNSADAVCTPCTKCSGSQYEAAVCTTTRDTICVDVTFPVGILQLNGTADHDDGTPIAVSHSSNVFLERLVDMKELETPMYVTNNQQTQDFVWHRESGIDIVVGISGVFLIPEYRELDVEDDSQYFLTQSMEAQSTLDLYSRTKKHYCRHPVPDYYNLHLEVIKNRTAAAQVVRCDSQDPSLPRCPESYKDGDRFLKWDINKKCDKYAASGENPDPLTILQNSFNAVVCADETAMDRDIFELSRPVTLEMMFPSAECSLYRSQCEVCLSASTCSNKNDDKSCCGLSCYNQGACYQFHSPSCPPAQVECASGEVHVFTVMPVFRFMAKEFQCHLHYQQPSYLYNITYSLSIPGLGFQVPQQNYTATARTLRQHRRYSDTFHFMQVWHDTRMPFYSDILLKGNHQELEATKDNHMQPYVLRSLKRNKDFSHRRRFFTTKKGDSEFTTAVQFERPFLYSSKSFHRNGCNKNTSQIFPNQTLHRNDAMRVISKKLGKEGDYSYEISHSDRSPYIKLSVKEGESVLRWFQGKTARGAIARDRLSGSLTWDSSMGHWRIAITGAVENCPAILTLQIFNKMMSACAGVYDIVVACPNNFTLNFNVSRTEDDLPDIFVIFLNDTLASHRLVLSSVIAPVSIPQSSLSAGEKLSRFSEMDLVQWSSIFAVVILSFIGLVVVFAVYLCIKHRSTTGASAEAAQSSANHAETAMLNNQSGNTASKTPETKQHKSISAKSCLCLFVTLYIVYSIVFTFSLTLVILYFTHHSLMGGVSGMANFSSQLQRELNASFHRVQLHESQEEVRLFRSVDSRMQACAHHLQQQNRQFLHSYHRSVTELLSHVFQKGGAIESLAGQSIVQNTSIYTEEIELFLQDCNKTVQSIVDRFSSHFMIHVKEVARNSWLDFPREVFLTQEGDPADRKYMSSNQLARFLRWLQVDKTDELLSVSDTVAARLASLKLPSPTEHLQRAFSSPFDDFASPLPTEPVVAGHTFLVLDRPASDSASPFFYAPTTADPLTPKPERAFLYGEAPSEGLQLEAGSESNFGDSPNREPLIGGQEELKGTAKLEPTDVEEGEEDFGLLMYMLIGLFLLLDVLLFAFRMSWLVNQVRAAKGGYEDRIPTDPVSQKLLAIQSGYHMTRMQEMYQSYSYSLENKENATSEERGSESEFNVYFCQSYPKSKDDILREIMAQKMNSTEQSLGQEKLPDSQQHNKSRPALDELPVVREFSSCCHWLHRMFISHLVWRFVVTAVVVLFLCLLVYTADFWLTTDNLRVLVGGQSALRDLHLQVHLTNRHLSGLASHLSTVLQDHRAAVQSEVSLSTALLSSTLQTQRELLVSLLERVCAGTGTPACNVSSYSSLPLPLLPTWQACNFLPAQPQLYQDFNAGSLNHMVAQQLSPLLYSVKHSLFSLCAIVIAMLCVMFLCHAGATVARYYMLIWGHLPRVQIFQISENTSLLYDGGPGSHKPMQRSASWLESCESGVYVGENEMDTNRDV